MGVRARLLAHLDARPDLAAELLAVLDCGGGRALYVPIVRDKPAVLLCLLSALYRVPDGKRDATWYRAVAAARRLR